MLTHIFDQLDRWLVAVAAIVLIGLGLLMNVEIGARTLFSRSTQVSDEFSGYGLCAITMLCLVPAMRRGRFLRVDGIVERLSPPLRRAAETFGALIGLAVSLVLGWSTGKLAWTSFQFDSRSIEMSQTPLAWPQALMPLGFALLSLAFAETAWRKARGATAERVEGQQ
jgi:TRAP-type C4-dicarboxylate transport system permease small subunit